MSEDTEVMELVEVCKNVMCSENAGCSPTQCVCSRLEDAVEKIQSQASEIERLKGALKPFSDALDDCDDEELDPRNENWPIWERPCALGISTKHLKVARQALNTNTQGVE